MPLLENTNMMFTRRSALCLHAKIQQKMKVTLLDDSEIRYCPITLEKRGGDFVVLNDFF